MYKFILLSVFLAPAALMAASVRFECVTEEPGAETRIDMPFSFNELKATGKMWTRSQLQVSSPQGDQKYCAVFEILKNFKRAGFVQTFSTHLPDGALISFTEESLADDEPAEFSHGTFQRAKSEPAIALTCTKKRP
jgi:hypothetical protein